MFSWSSKFRPVIHQRRCSIDKSNFRWSLVPFIYWMRLFGIELDQSTIKKRSFLARLSIGFFGIVIIVINMVCNFLWFSWNLDDYQKVIDQESEKSKERRKRQLILHLAPTIILISKIFLGSGVHLIFYILVLLTRRWKDLWSSFQHLQNQSYFRSNKKFYRQCRRHCYIGLILLLLV